MGEERTKQTKNTKQNQKTFYIKKEKKIIDRKLEIFRHFLEQKKKKKERKKLEKKRK